MAACDRRRLLAPLTAGRVRTAFSSNHVAVRAAQRSKAMNRD
jgi:hypothetical protein